MENELKLSESQIKRFERIWFVYGNGGSKHTMGNHKLIQGFYQYKEDRRLNYTSPEVVKDMKSRLGSKYKDWEVTQECIDACNEILINK